jgi:hypothetical protein
MKHALTQQQYLLEILKLLSSTNDKIRSCIQVNKTFRDPKCRPKLYCKARWTGGIVLLLSCKRAYDKGA